MTKPMIQIALDQTNLTDAVAVASNVASYVDVIEVGTILAFRGRNESGVDSAPQPSESYSGV